MCPALSGSIADVDGVCMPAGGLPRVLVPAPLDVVARLRAGAGVHVTRTRRRRTVPAEEAERSRPDGERPVANGTSASASPGSTLFVRTRHDDPPGRRPGSTVLNPSPFVPRPGRPSSSTALLEASCCPIGRPAARLLEKVGREQRRAEAPAPATWPWPKRLLRPSPRQDRTSSKFCGVPPVVRGAYAFPPTAGPMCTTLTQSSSVATYTRCNS